MSWCERDAKKEYAFSLLENWVWVRCRIYCFLQFFVFTILMIITIIRLRFLMIGLFVFRTV